MKTSTFLIPRTIIMDYALVYHRMSIIAVFVSTINNIGRYALCLFRNLRIIFDSAGLNGLVMWTIDSPRIVGTRNIMRRLHVYSSYTIQQVVLIVCHNILLGTGRKSSGTFLNIIIRVKSCSASKYKIQTLDDTEE